jgi:transcriptional regulator with XRE-family HTH domain
MTDTPNPFAQWLEATMQSRGLSQAQVAREVGVADVQVSRWRRGQVTPSVRYLQRIATTFDVPRATLESMAGYPGDRGAEEGVEVDPELEAELQAYGARYRELMETKLPRSLWRSYADACEALATELSDSFREALRTASRRNRQVGFQTRAQRQK